MAKIYGQIEKAQFENLTSNPSAAIKGLVWWNTTDLKMYVDDGSLVRAMLRNDGAAILGNNGTANNNIRFHRGASSVLQLVVGGDATAEGTLSTTLALLSARVESYTNSGKPAVGNAGRIAWITDSSVLQIDTGSSWVNVGGGGGGGSIVWEADETNAAEEATEFSKRVWKFGAGFAQVARCRIKVPTGYVSGSPIQVKIGLYSPTNSNTILLSSTSYLIRKNTDAFSSTTNSRSSTNAALTNTVANMFREGVLDVTSTTGTINSVAVSPGDIIEVVLTRGTDSDTADIRFIPSATEVTFS